MITIINANALQIPLADESVQAVITSPPYWGLRDYGVDGQLGLEPMHDCMGWATGNYCGKCYVCHMREVFSEVRRVLKPDGVLWLNLGDSYYNYRPGNGQSLTKQTISTHNRDEPAVCPRRANRLPGLKEKDLVGIPWRVAFALQADGWYLRQDIIWHKPNPMPESVRDRCTKAHEYVFMLTKLPRYYWDAEAIAERALMRPGKSGFGGPKLSTEELAHTNRPGKAWEKKPYRNKRSVWTIATRPYKGAHFATFPPDLVEPMVLASTRPGDIVLDPFAGTATVGVVCIKHRRQFIGLELNPDYIALAKERMANTQIRLF